ncbi:MAG: thioredoxin family protein [Tenericutes bacterium]|nr:thioredoxin family protein [Mycoplasmatota bacterium]
MKVKNYNITNTPALIINNKVISQGKVLTEKEIVKFLKVLS